MAQLGTALVEPYSIGSPDLVNPLPGGQLIEPFVLTAPELVESSNLVNRFPTPPTAWGFLIDYTLIDDDPAYDCLLPKEYGDIAGALTVEGTYLEPTVGQIWPR